jgi:exosome complex exonuclease DIS3/RRP44
VVGEVDGEVKTIYILGRKHFNRSIQGDRVAIQLLPKDQWKRGASVAIEEEEDEEKMFGEDEDLDKIDKMTEDDGEAEPTGKVVGIIRKKWRP